MKCFDHLDKDAVVVAVRQWGNDVALSLDDKRWDLDGFQGVAFPLCADCAKTWWDDMDD